jgi:hypothetical protein
MRVAFLDMTSIFAQMKGYRISPRMFRYLRRINRIRKSGTPGLA